MEEQKDALHTRGAMEHTEPILPVAMASRAPEPSRTRLWLWMWFSDEVWLSLDPPGETRLFGGEGGQFMSLPPSSLSREERILCGHSLHQP